MTTSAAYSSAQSLAFWSRFTSKERDSETGLDFFLARYYSGAQGRFLSPDEFKGGPDEALTGLDVTPPGPLPYADITNPQSLNKYAYTYNNPLRYTDPDGHCPICAAAIGALVLMAMSPDTANAPGPDDRTIKRSGDGQILANSAIGGAISYGVSKLGSVIGDVFGGSSRTVGTETVERAMSKVELKATKETGLIRGGREGTHYVSDAVNNSANRARERLSLPQKPEVKATMEVPAGKFSNPTKVKPDYKMPGGGTERTATGRIEAKIKKVKEYE